MALEIGRPEAHMKNTMMGKKLPGIPDEILAAHDVRTAQAMIDGKVEYRLVYSKEIVIVQQDDELVGVEVEVTWHTMN